MPANIVKGDFSAEELAERNERVRGTAREQGLDALVVYDTGTPLTRTGGATVRYLSNYFNISPHGPSVLVVPMRGEPQLCLSPGFQSAHFTWAGLLSPYKARGSGRGLTDIRAADIGEVLAESGFRSGRVGIDGMAYMSYRLLDGLRETLKGSELVDVTNLVYRSQLVRSKAEEVYIRRAAELSKTCMDAFLASIKPGMRQMEAVSIGEHATYMAGADEVTLFMTAGEPWVWGHLRSDLVFNEGDMVAVELNARYHGYFGQVCRSMPVGKVSEEKLRLYEASKTAHAAMLSLVKPGVTSQDMFRAGVAVVEEYGYRFSGNRYGHGMGMTIAEGFDIVERDTTPIPEGTYMMIHAGIHMPELGASATYGDQFMVRADGPELLSHE